MVLIEVLVLIVSIASIALFSQWNYSYWKRRNLFYLTPRFPFGNIENPLNRKYNLNVWAKKMYDDLKAQGEKHGGFYLFLRPIYLPIDPEMIKNVLLKDFNFFVDRGVYYNEKDDPLSAHLFAIGGQKWKDLRSKLTPTFTSGKMKVMFSTLLQCTVGMQEFVKAKCNGGEPLDIKNTLERFTIDVIGSCAFGIECNSFKKEMTEFQKHGLDVFKPSSLFMVFMRSLATSKPDWARSLGVTTIPKTATTFFLNVVQETVDYRQKNNFRRNDMLQILIDLKNNDVKLSIAEVAAQAFIFFLAGYETSSSTMTFCLYELASHVEIQDKVRTEINNVLAEQNEITYDATAKMKYLQQVIDETLRKYPSLGFVTRECVNDYRVPGTNVVIEKGTMVWIPIYGLHLDPEYFENPENFDPERFSAHNKQKIRPFTYLPFGEGQRLCLGMRFGLMQTKIGLITLLRDYKFSLNKRTVTPLTYNQSSIVLNSEKPIWLNIEKIL